MVGEKAAREKMVRGERERTNSSICRKWVDIVCLSNSLTPLYTPSTLGYDCRCSQHSIWIALSFLSVNFLKKIEKQYEVLRAKLSQVELKKLRLYITHQPALNFLLFIISYIAKDQIYTTFLKGKYREKAIHLQLS